MESEPSAPRILGPRDGKFGSLGMTGVRFLVGGPESGERFALVEHPMEPWALAGPLHRHRREDEYTFVLEGRIGAELGGVVVYGNPGNLIFKPRNQWHTFWNESDQPGRVLEIISPAGFERYFEELISLEKPFQPSKLLELAARYELEMDLSSIPRLIQQYKVRLISS
jgi:quercetin dioxygenase-like cupin family protein